METLYEGFGWKVTMEEAPLPNGRVKKGARVHRKDDSAQVIAHVSSSTILVLREFRAFHGAYIWMLPGGKVAKENIIDGMQRELQEETGYRAASMTHLWTSNVSDSLGFSHHVFLADDLARDPLPQDDDELMEVHEVEIHEALKRIESSPKVHLPSAYALRRYIDERAS